MRDLLELILKNITTHPDAVQIEEVTEEDTIVYNVTVDPEDMGRVIGKNGKVIRSIRSIAHVVGIRKDARFRINITEVGGLSEAADSSIATAAPTPDEEAVDDDLIAGAIDVSESSEPTKQS